LRISEKPGENGIGKTNPMRKVGSAPSRALRVGGGYDGGPERASENGSSPLDTLDSVDGQEEKVVGTPDSTPNEEVYDRLDVSTGMSENELDAEKPIDTPRTDGHDSVSSVSTTSEGSYEGSESAAKSAMREKARNGSCALNPAQAARKPPNARMRNGGTETKKGETPLGTYEHNG
jgi:hypothetical protein